MTPRTEMAVLPKRRAEYVLVQPPKDGHVHACIPIVLTIPGIEAVCGASIGPLWTSIRAYRLRGAARKRVTCFYCRKALRSPGQQKREEVNG